ncbi:Uncharacterised protein [Segatella copri]|nr:Uncharacterised protein [Segatella copri]
MVSFYERLALEEFMAFVNTIILSDSSVTFLHVTGSYLARLFLDCCIKFLNLFF